MWDIYQERRLMNKTQFAKQELYRMDKLGNMDTCVHRITPVSKFILTLGYILTVMSFGRYDIYGLFVMILFPVVAYQLAIIPVHTCFYKFRFCLPIVCLIGVLNPFFDQRIVMVVGRIGISGGVVSMVSLIMKGLFCLMATFLYVATSGIEGLCAALYKLHLPESFITHILLTFRYVSILLDELSRMTQAYKLRAPNQRGIAFKAWGSFLGQLLLRAMDRGQSLYENMLLRGYNGKVIPREQKYYDKSWLVTVVVIIMMLFVRFVVNKMLV